MKSLLASARTGGGLDRVDHAVQWLEDQWRRHDDVQLERAWTEQKRVLAVDREDSVVLLAELIKTDLRCRFARGQTPTVAGYLERFPELRASDTRILSLIYEEFCLGEERGDRIDVESFCNRYSRWKDSLVSQLQYHHLFSQAAGLRPAPPPFPEPGDQFEEFELVAVLGKGGTSRVFLARDLSLGGKQVVLKVSLDRGQEPQAQGALNHPHIVPVNSVVFDDRQLRGLSMPFRPGLPLDEIIKRVNPAARPRWALAFWKALVEGIAAGPSHPDHPEGEAIPDRRAAPRGDGWEGFPVRGTYAQGAAWIALVVARALDHAHRKQTYHRDVKPGNVLLTLDYGPQLLDFNLAESPHSARQAEAAIHGGTLPYMAPEQIGAFLNPELWGQVGAKADIYSLGLVLRELLTGQAPDLPAQTLSTPRALRVLLDRRPLLEVSVRRSNPAIPHALEAIVAKCLAVAPQDRYPDAQALADDLQRFVQHQPLVHTANPSRRERAGDWLIRHQRRLAATAGFLIVLGALLFRPAIDRLKTPIEHAQGFLAAVQNIEDGRFEQAQKRLEGLSWWYPESGLRQVYLGFALDGLRHVAEANVGAEGGKDVENSMKLAVEAGDLFRKAMADPAAMRRLKDWAREHPQIALQLESFADERFKLALKLAENDAAQKNSAPKIREDRKNLYHLARPALELALELQPDLIKASRLLAIVEERDHNYQKAHEWASRSIDSARRALDRVAQREHSDEEVVDRNGDLFSARTVRGRITRSIADLRVRGDLQSTREMFDLLRGSIADLDWCEQYLATRPKNKLNHSQAYYLLSNKSLVLLTLGEIELDLRWIPEATEYLRRAEGTINQLTQLAKEMGVLLPKDIPIWEKRIEADLRGLGAVEVPGEVTPEPPEPPGLSAPGPRGVGPRVEGGCNPPSPWAGWWVASTLRIRGPRSSPLGAQGP